MSKELIEILREDNLDKFQKQYWNKLSEAEKANHLSLESGTYFRKALIHGKANVIQFFVDQLVEDAPVLVTDEENLFPLFTQLMTTKNFWLDSSRYMKSKDLFYLVCQKLSEENQANLENYVVAENGLADYCLLENKNAFNVLFTWLEKSRERQDLITPFNKKYAERYGDVSSQISHAFDVIGMGLGSKSRSSMERDIKRLVFSSQSKEKVDRRVISAIKSLDTYMRRGLKAWTPETHEKREAVLILISKILNEKKYGDTPLEKITDMKNMVKELLDNREEGENPLLINRSGKHGYSKASKVATFFKRPDYEYTDSQGEHHYADSSVEHRLIVLFHALEKWEEKVQEEQQEQGLELR